MVVVVVVVSVRAVVVMRMVVVVAVRMLVAVRMVVVVRMLVVVRVVVHIRMRHALSPFWAWWCRGTPPSECSAWKMASETGCFACSFSRR